MFRLICTKWQQKQCKKQKKKLHVKKKFLFQFAMPLIICRRPNCQRTHVYLPFLNEADLLIWSEKCTQWKLVFVRTSNSSTLFVLRPLSSWICNSTFVRVFIDISFNTNICAQCSCDSSNNCTFMYKHAKTKHVFLHTNKQTKIPTRS